MLKFFNRLEKTRNFVLLIFAILMVGSLVFFYTPARNSYQSGNLALSDETAASVSGEKISVGDLVRQKEQYSRFSQGRPFPAKMMLEGLIGSRITRIESARLGLTASDAEIAAEIRKQSKTDDGKPFDEEKYKQNMIDQFGSVAAFEQTIRDDVSSRKLDAFITSGVTVSEEEVLSDYQRKNTKFDLSYVAINSSELAKTIAPTDQELRDYFEKNKASYYINVPQKKIRYIFINTSKIGEKLPITDADLKAEYDALAPDKKVAGVLGQEIVLRVAKPEFDAQVQTKASQLVEQLRVAGPVVSEDAFATMAKGQSENPASAPSGGKLKGPVTENKEKADDPYQQLLRMQPGEITDPISYKGRYFILRRGDDVQKTFEMAKKELDVSARNRRAYDVAVALAQKISDELKQNKDLQKTAKDFAAQTNMNVKDMIKETAFIKPGDNVPDIGISQQFEEGIAPLENANDVGEKTPIQNGFAVPMLVEKREPRDAEFDDVRSQIVDIVKLEKAKSQVEQIANAIAAGANTAAGLSAAATAKGLKAKDQKSFVLGSPLGEGSSASTNQAMEDAIFAMKIGDVTKTPLKAGDNLYIVGVTNREEANMADFTKQHDMLLGQMLSRRRSDVFSDYLAAIKKRLQDGGYIKIYKDAVAKADAPVSGLPTDDSDQ